MFVLLCCFFVVVVDFVDLFDVDDVVLFVLFVLGVGMCCVGLKCGVDGWFVQFVVVVFDVDGVVVSDEVGVVGVKCKKKLVVDKLVKIVDKFVKFGFMCLIDFVLYLLMCYEDEIMFMLIGELLLGGIVQIEGVVFDNEVVYWLCCQFVVKIWDDDGEQFVLCFLNFYGLQVKQMVVGQWLCVCGDVCGGFFGMEMVYLVVCVVEVDVLLLQVFMFVYLSMVGVLQVYLCKVIENVVECMLLFELLLLEIQCDYLKLFDVLMFEQVVCILYYLCVDLDEVVLMDGLYLVWMCIKFEELFVQQLLFKCVYEECCMCVVFVMLCCIVCDVDVLIMCFYVVLLFMLMGVQVCVVDEIVYDFMFVYLMQWLLQGDVGSGKMVVVVLVVMQVIDVGYQVVLMVFIEIFVEQYVCKLCVWFELFGVMVVWFVGSLKVKEKCVVIEVVVFGIVQFVIGMYVIIQDMVEFVWFGFVIVDEQYCFGVEQCFVLCVKVVNVVNGVCDFQLYQLMMLVMLILCMFVMMYYVDFEVLMIDELLFGCMLVLMCVVGDVWCDEVIVCVCEVVFIGCQVYWVCLLIEESEMLQLQMVVEIYEMLVVVLFEFKVGFVYGWLLLGDKVVVMEVFMCNEVQLLVVMMVIEVGVDVLNVLLMVIEYVECFGFVQLYQLCGWVGCGIVVLVCVLLYSGLLLFIGCEWLKMMCEMIDGFEIVWCDFEICGLGEFFGVCQLGVVMLCFVNFEIDGWLIDLVCEVVVWLIVVYLEVVMQYFVCWFGVCEQYLKV